MNTVQNLEDQIDSDDFDDFDDLNREPFFEDDGPDPLTFELQAERHLTIQTKIGDLTKTWK